MFLFDGSPVLSARRAAEADGGGASHRVLPGVRGITAPWGRGVASVGRDREAAENHQVSVRACGHGVCESLCVRMCVCACVCVCVLLCALCFAVCGVSLQLGGAFVDCARQTDLVGARVPACADADAL